MNTYQWSGISCLAFLCGCSAEKSTDIGPVEHVQQALSYGTLGIHCTDTYEEDASGNPWLANRPHGWTICNGVWDTLNATQQFSYNLAGKRYYWEAGGDQATNSLEDVDMFFGLTHGGYNATYSNWGMWDESQWARSNQMALGDDGDKLSIFAVHACDALHFDDNFWTRWDSVFRGLRMALGGHGSLSSNAPEQYVGEDFANYLNEGLTFKSAWSYAYENAEFNNMDPGIATVSTNAANCALRRDGMRWTNYTGYSRVENPTRWCGWYWENI